MVARPSIFPIFFQVFRLTKSRYGSDMDVGTFKSWILGALRLRPSSGRMAVSSPILDGFGVWQFQCVYISRSNNVYGRERKAINAVQHSSARASESEGMRSALSPNFENFGYDCGSHERDTCRFSRHPSRYLNASNILSSRDLVGPNHLQSSSVDAYSWDRILLKLCSWLTEQ